MSSIVLTRPAGTEGPLTTATYNVVNPTEFQYSGPDNSSVNIYNEETGALVATLSPSSPTFTTSLPGTYRLETKSVCCSDIVVWAGDIVIGGGGGGGAGGDVNVYADSTVALPDICVYGGGEEDPVNVTPVAVYDGEGNYLRTDYFDLDTGEQAPYREPADDCRCKCRECTDNNITARNCVLVYGFDLFDDNFIEAGETSNMKFIVNGVTLVDMDVDYLASSDHQHKSSFYTAFVDAVDALDDWAMNVEEDSLLTEQKKAWFKLEYFGMSFSTVNVELRKNEDHYYLALNNDGTFTGTTYDGEAEIEFASGPHFKPCV